ncbi:hypothetical protein NHQ30_008542 [Ciborinia camelliae]|nr:hypothetical protein NHQ30_008542 [Ciborinia camelliae]
MGNAPNIIGASDNFEDDLAPFVQNQLDAHRSEQLKSLSYNPEQQPWFPRMPKIKYMAKSDFNDAHEKRDELFRPDIECKSLKDGSGSQQSKESKAKNPSTPNSGTPLRWMNSLANLRLGSDLEKSESPIPPAAATTTMRIRKVTFDMIEPRFRATETQFPLSDNFTKKVEDIIWAFELPGPRVISIKPGSRGSSFNYVDEKLRLLALGVYRNINHINHFLGLHAIYINDKIDAISVTDINISNWLYSSFSKSNRQNNRQQQVVSFPPLTADLKSVGGASIRAPKIIWDASQYGIRNASALAAFVKKMSELKTPPTELLLVLATPEDCWNTPGWLKGKSQEERREIAGGCFEDLYEFLFEDRRGAFACVTLVSMMEVEERFYGMQLGLSLFDA